jgi:hypothetical protein
MTTRQRVIVAMIDGLDPRYVTPQAMPGIYSAEINHWLWTVAVDLLRTHRDLDLLYVHTTDYPCTPGRQGIRNQTLTWPGSTS